MLDALAATLPLREADLITLADSDEVVVRDDDGTEFRCRRLQTSAAPPVDLVVGDRVLVAVPAGAVRGYVLGRVGPPRPLAPVPSDPEGRTVEIVVPDGVDTVRIAGRKITIAADDSLSLECGGGSVRIDKRGKVVVLGTDITSRAKRLHKVKGASVAIN